MNEKINFWKDALKFSLILSLILIILTLVVYIFDLITISLFAGILIALITFVISFIVLSILVKSYRNDKLNGFITYGKALGFSIIISLYASIILSAYNIVFTKIIDPSYEKNISMKMQAKTEEYMINQGLPDDMIEDSREKAEEKMKKHEERGIVAKTSISIISNLIMLVLASLIGAAIAKKNMDPYKSAMQEVEE